MNWTEQFDTCLLSQFTQNTYCDQDFKGKTMQVFFWSDINWVFFRTNWVFSHISKILDFDRVFCHVIKIKSKKKKKQINCDLRQCNCVFHQHVKSLIRKKKNETMSTTSNLAAQSEVWYYLLDKWLPVEMDSWFLTIYFQDLHRRLIKHKEFINWFWVLHVKTFQHFLETLFVYFFRVWLLLCGVPQILHMNFVLINRCNRVVLSVWISNW